MIGFGLNIWEPGEYTTTTTPEIETCIQDGTIELLYDASRQVIVTGGNVVSWSPVIGGTSSDTLVAVGGSVTYETSVTEFGERPAIKGVATGVLRSNLPASAKYIAQPLTAIAIYQTASMTDARVVFDGATATERCELYTSGTYHRLYAGASGTGRPSSPQQYYFSDCLFNAAASSMFSYRRDGVAGLTSSISAGSYPHRGCTILGTYAVSAISDGRITVYAIIKNYSVDDRTRLINWCRNVMGWT